MISGHKIVNFTNGRLTKLKYSLSLKTFYSRDKYNLLDINKNKSTMSTLSILEKIIK